VSLSVGGSGAMFGLLAALLIILRRLHQDVRQILLWLGLNVLITISFIRSISWQAHLGGFIGGAIVTAALVLMPRAYRSRNQALALAAYVVVLAALMLWRALTLAA